MISQMEQCLRLDRLIVSVAASVVLFLAVPAIARAGGESDSGGRAAAAAATRTSPLKRSRQPLVEERSMASAMAGKRDPFKVPLPPETKAAGDGIEGPLPPGARGLVIGYLRLKGIVREEDSKAMIAVVANHENLAYFLHIHQNVYNGVVSSITPNAVYFQKLSLDSSGRVIAQEVVLRLGSAPQEAR